MNFPVHSSLNGVILVRRNIFLGLGDGLSAFDALDCLDITASGDEGGGGVPLNSVDYVHNPLGTGSILLGSGQELYGYSVAGQRGVSGAHC